MSEISLGGLNFVDIIILIIFAVSMLIGFGRGLINELLSLIILIAAFIVAILFTNPLADFLNQTATMQNVVSQASSAANTDAAKPLSYMMIAVSFGILFVGTLIIGAVLKALLNLIVGTGIYGLAIEF